MVKRIIQRKSLAVIPTGVPGLDTVLGGGLMEGGLYLAEGVAGAGKTIMSSQICFRQVEAGKKVLYITLIAESHIKLMQHLQGMSFYDETAVSRSLLFISGYQELLRDGMAGFLALIARALRDHHPAFMVLDGFRTAREFCESELTLARFIHELNALVSTTRCTTLLLAPLSGNLPQAEYTLVDGLLELNLFSNGMRRAREIEVHKLRGANHLLGKHYFNISHDGMTVYPRLEALDSKHAGQPDRLTQRMGFGIAGFDRMLFGGLVRGSSTVLIGASGAGKTLLGLKFLEEGARRRERCLYFGFYEAPERLLGKAASVQIPLQPWLDKKLLTITWHPAVELVLDELAHQLIGQVVEQKISRLVIDGIDGFRSAALRPDRFTLFLNALTHKLRELDVTTLLTEELPFYEGGERQMLARASAMTENVIVFRYVEVAARQHRLISVMKLRESDYDSSIREFVIGASGIEVGQPYHLREQSFRPLEVDAAPAAAAGREPEPNKKGAGKRHKEASAGPPK